MQIKKFLSGFLFICFTAGAQTTDFELLKKINATDKPSWDKTMKVFSFTSYPVGIATPISILAHGYLKKDRVLIRNGYKSAATIVVAMGISTVLKYSVQRQRPSDKYPGEIIVRDHVSTFSFPSGHTTSAFASATSLSLTYKKWYVAVPAFTYAGMMGYSRMRLGVHYPSDVLAGALIGSGTGFLTWKLEQWLRKRSSSPPAIQENP